MGFEIRFTPEAEETFQSIIFQIRQRWGDRFVSRFKSKVSQTLTTISTSPYLYPIVEEQIEMRKCILHKNCSMLYKVYDDTIVIICFWDNRQQPLIS